jgi:hypothetical protein
VSDSPGQDSQPHGHRPSGGRAGGRPTGGRPGYGKANDGKPTAGRPASGRPTTGKPANGRPTYGKPSDGKPSRGAAGGQGSSSTGGQGRGSAGQDRRPERGRDRGQEEKRLWTEGGAPARGDSSARERELPEDRDPFGTRSVRSRHDDPVIPDDVKPADLDRVARNELKTLSKENAEGVACHLVMAARLIADDPELAHQHAISAARRAGRIGVVRETLAITAYATGDYALALRELRTYRRITGRDDQLPMMVDSERGMGRPERALELGRSVPRTSLPVPVQVELAIAMSGARLDLGDTEAALLELQIPQLDPATAFSYSPGLFDAYAAVLEDLGRSEDAEEWYTRADIAAAALQGAGDPEDDTIEVIEEELELDAMDGSHTAEEQPNQDSAGDD